MKQLFGLKKKPPSPKEEPAGQTPARAAETPEYSAETVTATKNDQGRTSPTKSAADGDKQDNKHTPKIT